MHENLPPSPFILLLFSFFLQHILYIGHLFFFMSSATIFNFDFFVYEPTFYLKK